MKLKEREKSRSWGRDVSDSFLILENRELIGQQQTVECRASNKRIIRDAVLALARKTNKRTSHTKRKPNSPVQRQFYGALQLQIIETKAWKKIHSSS